MSSEISHSVGFALHRYTCGKFGGFRNWGLASSDALSIDDWQTRVNIPWGLPLTAREGCVKLRSFPGCGPPAPAARRLCHWHFADYGAGELGRIFQFHGDRGHYQVTRAAQIKLLLGFDWQLRHRAAQFGYGHGVQRVFERAVQQLAGRIAGISPLTRHLLTTVYDVDIAISGTPENVFGSLTDPQRTFTIHCPGCDSVNVVGPEFLGICVEFKPQVHYRTSRILLALDGTARSAK